MKYTHPPKGILRFFRWFCHPDLHPYIEGDLIELYQERVSEIGQKKAKWRFLLDVLLLFRPTIIRPLSGYRQLNQYGMLKNYFTVAWRGILSQRLYSIINVGGLTVGLTAFILIFVYVQHELSYNQHFSNESNIYRVYQEQPGNVFMGTDKFAVTPATLASALKAEYADVSNATTISERTYLLSKEDAHFYQPGIWADSSFFQIFNYKFIEGDASNVFDKPLSIVLTESFASKIFGETQVVGETLSLTTYSGKKIYTVTGVINDPLPTSSFQMDYIINLASDNGYVSDIESNSWNNNSFHTFLSLHQGADPKALESNFPDLLIKYTDLEEGEPAENIYFLQPLRDLYFESKINFDVGKKGNLQYVVLFSIVAICVLVLACINYMNLAITRSLKRAKEVGLRKVIGAYRSQLIIQFLSESILMAFIALGIALLFSTLLVPVVAAILERPLVLNLWENAELWMLLLLLISVVGIFSGSYPALFMSALKPVRALKGEAGSRRPKMRLQSALMIFQYSASIVLIIASLVIYQQFKYIQNQVLGYDTEQIMVVNIRSAELRENIDLVKSELSKNANVMSVTTSVALPSTINSSSTFSTLKNADDNQSTTVYRTTVDYDYLKTFGLELVSGRNFSLDIQPENEGVIINESAAKAFGWTVEEAIGKSLYNRDVEYPIIGVIKDFHMFSLHLAIQPLMLTLKKDFAYLHYASIKIKSDDQLQNTIALVEEEFQKYSNYPFEFRFMDDEYDRLYKSDIRLMKIFTFFTVIAILIASLGLFGLAAYTAKLRTKEIGIRKVLGAPIKMILGLLAKDYVLIVGIGFLVALPIAWYFMNIWLQDYAYKISLEWWIFGVAGLLAVVIALITISLQSVKAALANPVDALKTE